MSHFDNLSTREEQERQRASMDDGFLDGDAFRGYPLPEFCNKAVKMLTPYERGFLIGWWSKMEGWTK